MRSISGIAGLFLLGSLCACSNSDFAGTSASKKKREGPSETPDAEDDTDEKDTDSSGPMGNEENADNTDDDTDDNSGIESDEDESVTSRRKKCGTAAEKTKSLKLDFPSTTGTACKWGEDGNLSASGGPETRAVFQQPKSIDLGTDTLCGITFDGGSANVTYDDFMFFTFDGFILASVQFTEPEFLAMGMTKVGDLIQYDKAKHVGKGPYEASMNSRTNSICPKGGTCSMVKSQTAGALAIDAPQAWFDLLPEEKLKQAKHDLSVWVTGQAHSTDCQHSGLSFDLTIKYVE